jgi:3-oxoacyl-[acyl-carrier protein] reductase
MNTPNFDFQDADVLVTGGTSGIGQGIATAFAAAGANVTITGTRAGAGDYEDDLSMFSYRQCQMRDQDSIDGLVESLGNLDILINNAGGTFPAGDEYEPDGYVAAVTQNMFGPMRLTMGCYDRLKTSSAVGGASVVNIISMSAFRSAVYVPGYSSSKAGLLALTMNLSRRWAADGIRVNAVAPGVIESRMTELAMQVPQIMDYEIGFHTPLGRTGTPADCAGAVLFLCTDSASYITGASIPVDGGYLTV